MDSAEPRSDLDVCETPRDLVEVGNYPTAAEGFERGLVALTLGRPFWLIPAANDFRLLVEPDAASELRRQLACFEREKMGWPPRPITDAGRSNDAEFVTPLLWCLVVIAVFWWQGKWPSLSEAGAVDADAIFHRGEWWRPITALFLHADLGHLSSNLLSGLFAFSAVLMTVGRARGWLLLLVSAVAGNVVAAALNHAASYRSLGASTAIFAALGLLTGRAVRVVLRANHPHRWRTLFVPLAAGLTVLALYGAGGQQVDVVAHVTGFISGLMLGYIAAAREP